MIALPQRGGPGSELTSRPCRNSDGFFIGSSKTPSPTLGAKTFAGQDANKRREDGGLFIIANYWEFLPECRLNDNNEQHNGNVGTFAEEFGDIERFWGFKSTIRISTGHANLKEHR